MVEQTQDIVYHIRISKRARFARIIVRSNQYVEVVLPQGVARRHAAQLVREKQAWLQRCLQRMQKQAQEKPEYLQQALPQRIVLIGEESFQIHYQKQDRRNIKLTQQEQCLYLRGPVSDKGLVQQSLQQWLKYYASEVLTKRLQVLADKYGFYYQKATIRLQKTRWGSCTMSGHISLNAKLLLLPEHLQRHVLLHELTHLEYMNHSPAFWQRLAQCDSDCLKNRKALNSVAHYIPVWVES